MWQRQGSYEYEYNESGYTGWCRTYMGYPIPVGATWQEWNNKTGETRERKRIN